MATNFDVLYQTDQRALVDLLTCYREDRSCEDCRFAKYGCPDGELYDEGATLNWLSREATQ